MRPGKLWIAPLLLSTAFATSAWSSDGRTFAPDATFSTLITTPLGIEGLTGDAEGNLYAGGRSGVAGEPCPVWRISLTSPSLVVVGNVPAASPTALCGPLGAAFDASGRLAVADSGSIYRFVPNAELPPTAELFASNLPGANGIAFDRTGNLWVSDGGTSQGRVWKLTPGGVASEAFRVQPTSNDVNLVDGVGGVGRDFRGLPGGTVSVTPTSRTAANLLGSQAIVANGLAFGRNGDLFVADTARGAIWRVRFDEAGNLQSRTGCDTTFAADTLCLENVFVEHPALEGADGIALDRFGDIYVSANERNALVVVTFFGTVIEAFRNAPDALTQLRNTGPLEFPTSPFLLGQKLCTTGSDGSRRDNAPSTAGDVGGPGQNRAKISCMDQPLLVPGLALPVR